VIEVSHEHAELSDSIAHKVDVHRPDEHAVDLGQDQRLSAKKALDQCFSTMVSFRNSSNHRPNRKVATRMTLKVAPHLM
jgi:hypothetical protein